MKVDLEVMDTIIKATKKQNGATYINYQELENLCQVVRAAKEYETYLPTVEPKSR